MSTLDPSVVDWIIAHPESMALLEELGIDGTCAGKSLADSCSAFLAGDFA